MKILQGDALKCLSDVPEKSVQTCITSPPYFGLRDYGVEGQIGLEETPEAYVQKLVDVFREVRRVLKDDGTLWLNLGDSYAASPAGNFGKDMSRPGDGGAYRENKPKMDWKKMGFKPKDLIGIPWRVAFALQADGWYLRQDLIWAKPNPMPESVTDRCTKSHEYVFLLAKSQRYYYDAEAIKEKAQPDTSVRDRDNTKLNNTPGRTKMAGSKTNGYETRNRRSVWTISTKPYPEAHFATFPEELVEPMILAGSKKNDIVLDPFAGSGTTLAVAKRLGRDYLGVELNSSYIELANRRLAMYQTPML